ncbi:MAG TPA: hypothetical protein VGZ29_08770 [Terriglobia bacterium]|nr:hypothetical protein [Terriglobia bacterium]
MKSASATQFVVQASCLRGAKCRLGSLHHKLRHYARRVHFDFSGAFG